MLYAQTEFIDPKAMVNGDRNAVGSRSQGLGREDDRLCVTEQTGPLASTF